MHGMHSGMLFVIRTARRRSDGGADITITLSRCVCVCVCVCACGCSC